MNNALTVQDSLVEELLPINIEAIKKAFIELYKLPAANEQIIRPASTIEHVLQVKDWLQDSERELGIKAKVMASPVECGINYYTPAAIVENEPVIFANYVDQQKQALDVFEYVVVGLLGVQRLLDGTNKYERMFADLSQDTKEFIAQRHNLDLNNASDKLLMMKLYLADLAALNVTLTWLERREAWQRQCVRILYPKLRFTSLDLHYLLLKSRRLIKKNHKLV